MAAFGKKFNIDHPADFKGHSLSVSDIVVLHQNDEDTAHYVDSIGFSKCRSFCRSSRPPYLTSCRPNSSKPCPTPYKTLCKCWLTKGRIACGGASWERCRFFRGALRCGSAAPPREFIVGCHCFFSFFSVRPVEYQRAFVANIARPGEWGGRPSGMRLLLRPGSLAPGCRAVRKRAFAAGRGEAHVFVGQRRGFAAAGVRLRNPPDEKRFVNLLDRAGLLADGRGDGVQSDGPPLNFSMIVERMRLSMRSSPRESMLSAARAMRVMARSMCPSPLDHREVAHAPQQGVGDARRAARAQGHLVRRVVVDRDVENPRRPPHDAGQDRSVVILQVALDAEPRP